MKSFATFMTAALLATASFTAFAAEGAPAPKAPPKPDLVKGEASYTAVCAACHGADGNSGAPANPKLAQQHPEYLVKQLQEFKNDKRKDPVMKGFASALSDDDMRNIAWWVTSKKAKPGFAKEKDLVSRHSGAIPASGRPACRLHRQATAGLPRRRAAEQHADAPGGGQAERPRDPRRVGLHRRPALNRRARRDRWNQPPTTNPKKGGFILRMARPFSCPSLPHP